MNFGPCSIGSTLSFKSQEGFVNTYAPSGYIRDPERLKRELISYIFRRKKADVLKDLPPITRITHSTTLPSTHAERYQKALDGVYERLDGRESNIQNILVELNALRQIVADAKAEATYDYVQNLLESDPDAKVIIFSNFIAPARRLAEQFGVDCIFGDVSNHVRMEMVDRFNSELGPRVLTLTVPVGQEGLNITGATHVVFNDLAWTPKDHMQGEARTYGRLNNLHGATAVYVEIARTVDAFMRELLNAKQNIIEQSVDGTTEQAEAMNSMLSEVVNWLRNAR